MVCRNPQVLPAPLPEGYTYAFYKPGMEDAWCQIQCSVRDFSNPEEVNALFHTEFGDETDLLSKRLLFVCDRRHRAVATGALWHKNGYNRLHMVAVVPGMHHRGIGMALISKLMSLYYEEQCQGIIYLTTNTRGYRAINIYRKCGFQPDSGKDFVDVPLDSETYTKAWRIVDNKLKDYEKRRKRKEPGDTTGTGGAMEVNSGFDKTKMCKISTLTTPGQAVKTMHYHLYSQIWYVTQGSCIHKVEGQSYTMSAGDAFFIPPKVAHSTELDPESNVICCEFDLESVLQHNVVPYDKIREITGNISFSMLFQKELFSTRPQFTFSKDGQKQMERLMNTMLDEYNRGDQYYEDFLQLQILQLLLIIARELQRPPVDEAVKSNLVFDKYREMVVMAVNYIDEHFDKPLTLDGMCRISMVSKTYFCYIFKILTGKTFVEYLMEKRIERSMTLLRTTESSVIEIGHAVGFHEPTHFSRTFKKLRGISPREYRNNTILSQQQEKQEKEKLEKENGKTQDPADPQKQPDPPKPQDQAAPQKPDSKKPKT